MHSQGCEFHAHDDPIFSIISTVTISGETWKRYPDDGRACDLRFYYK